MKQLELIFCKSEKGDQVKIFMSIFAKRNSTLEKSRNYALSFKKKKKKNECISLKQKKKE